MAALTTSVALVTDFEHLNDDRTLSVKPNAASREREAIVDVTFDDGDYEAGGVIVDFSKIRKFTKVYYCQVVQGDVGAHITYIPGAGNGAALGKLKVFGVDFDGSPTGIDLFTELAAGSTVLDSKVLRVHIRGV